MSADDKLKLGMVMPQMYSFTAEESGTSITPTTSIQDLTLLAGQKVYVYISSYSGRRELEVDTVIGLQVEGSGKQEVWRIERSSLEEGASASVAVSDLIDGAVNIGKTLTIRTDGRIVTGVIYIA